MLYTQCIYIYEESKVMPRCTLSLMSALQLRHPPLLPPSIEHEYGSTYSLWHDMYALQVSWWKLKVQGMIAENGERNRQDQSFEEEARIQHLAIFDTLQQLVMPLLKWRHSEAKQWRSSTRDCL